MKLPTMSMDIFEKSLETIDEHYPFPLSPKLILALLVMTGVCFIIFGRLFIWYKRKTTLTTSMVGNLHKLIPSLTEKKPSLNSLLPMLSEFIFPANTKNTNIDTTAAVSRKSSSDVRPSPTMIPHHETKLNKPKISTPSSSTIKTEPISLELFNHAAADLDKKGEIELDCYKKYLFNHD